MKALKTAGWYFYASLVSILTLGLFIRFHLITVRKRTLGVRAGVLGCTHVQRGAEFLIISTWHGKKRFPANRIAYAQTGPLRVKLESSGGKTAALRTWQTRTVADYINKQINR